MILKINGQTVDGLTEAGQKLVDKANGKLLCFKDSDWSMNCTDVPVPDLSQAPEGVLDHIDHINYAIMSKTQITEFLYRYTQDNTRAIVDLADSVKDLFF